MAMARQGRRRPGMAVVLTAALALAACDVPVPADPPQRPVARPDRPAPPKAVPPAASAESVALRRYYARIEEMLLSQGLLRQDGGGPDTPYDARRLAETFVRVALNDEYVAIGNRLVQRETPSQLWRWDRPVHVELVFGASVPPARRAADRAVVAGYVARLARVTGHPISVVPSKGNFTVYVVNENERRALAPALRHDIATTSDRWIGFMTGLDRDSYCVVQAFSASDTGTYDRAIAIIREETAGLMRRACLHEEIAQGLGLINDTPFARPSIFNDDEEFALLTTHDEQLLRMLYDPRLAPGMRADEAAPIALAIATELMGGDA